MPGLCCPLRTQHALLLRSDQCSLRHVAPSQDATHRSKYEIKLSALVSGNTHHTTPRYACSETHIIPVGEHTPHR